MDQALADQLREAVKTFDSWNESRDGFYKNSMFHFPSDEVSPSLRHLLTPGVHAEVHSAMETTFGVSLRVGANMMLNRFDAGDGTLVHNDCLTDTEHPYFFTHRCLLYLTEDWDPSMGGVLGIFDGQDSRRPARTVEPHHNSMSAMAMGPNSYHAVSAQIGPPRYSIVWSFCTQDEAHQL